MKEKLWKYNVSFSFSNPVASQFGEKMTVTIYTYKKSRYAVIQSLQLWVQQNYNLGDYTEIDERSVKYTPPILV